MPVTVSGMEKGHEVTLDSTTKWPRVLITCTCGWKSELDGHEEHAMKDAISRIWIHTGGPDVSVGQGGRVLLDRNTFDDYMDFLEKQALGNLGT